MYFKNMVKIFDHNEDLFKVLVDKPQKNNNLLVEFLGGFPGHHVTYKSNFLHLQSFFLLNRVIVALLPPLPLFLNCRRPLSPDKQLHFSDHQF